MLEEFSQTILYSLSTGGNMIYGIFGYFGEPCYILWKSDLKENLSELSSTHNQKLLYAYLARSIQHEWYVMLENKYVW